MDVPLRSTAVAAAIHAGVEYLSRAQLPSGEFTTYTGPDLHLRGATPYPKSVYVTTFVVHSLGYLPDGPVVERIRRRAGDFLEAEEEDNGTWNYEGRGEWRLPAELDTTCCAVAALLALGRRPLPSFYPLLWQVVRRNEAAPGGPYYTYLGVNDAPDDPVAAPFAREVDRLVNANVVFCCGLLGIDLPGAVEYLARGVRSGDYRGQSHYVISPHFVIYSIARAHADGGVRSLASVVPAMREFLATRLPPPAAEASALNLACRAVGLLNLGVGPERVQPYVPALLAAQQADGDWPVGAAWAGFPPNFDGSPALTTALALEALAKWQRGVEDDATDTPLPSGW